MTKSYVFTRRCFYCRGFVKLILKALKIILKKLNLRSSRKEPSSGMLRPVVWEELTASIITVPHRHDNGGGHHRKTRRPKQRTNFPKRSQGGVEFTATTRIFFQRSIELAGTEWRHIRPSFATPCSPQLPHPNQLQKRGHAQNETPEKERAMIEEISKGFIMHSARTPASGYLI